MFFSKIFQNFKQKHKGGPRQFFLFKNHLIPLCFSHRLSRKLVFLCAKCLFISWKCSEHSGSWWKTSQFWVFWLKNGNFRTILVKNPCRHIRAPDLGGASKFLKNFGDFFWLSRFRRDIFFSFRSGLRGLNARTELNPRLL